ncbi:TetR/AcrR family transcriptional regulator [Gordonia hankookensis]|uniref:TetR/AcrR family transcriptional regulator C-terminal domain-containing protein n=1 Tax=Gordonia hankookensis TaxID=589403 RepID=A0ABR7WD95_9ACTN|nr:TetR family transcriptional regulator [Gordonia hankookensis]MBD1320751.1 TetR/AcrR family transcriptional regulator C-terminal domain-containing protein [Gordonia hankookensis]
MARKENAPKRERRERGSIDPEEIIKGAFELAEEIGVDNLSMPLLGKHLGVGVTSIYWYFRKKDDLLNAMTDRALERYGLAAALKHSSDDWRTRLHDHAHAMRDVFLKNPILCDLILIRSSLGPRNAQLGALEIERSVENLMREGLSLEDAYDSYSAVQLHVRGSVVLERLHEKNKAEDSAAQAYYENLIITPDQTPLLAEAAAKGRVGGAPDEQNFEYGLSCILDHTSRLIDEQKNAPTSAAKRSRSATKAPATKAAPRRRAKSAAGS